MKKGYAKKRCATCSTGWVVRPKSHIDHYKRCPECIERRIFTAKQRRGEVVKEPVVHCPWYEGTIEGPAAAVYIY